MRFNLFNSLRQIYGRTRYYSRYSRKEKTKGSLNDLRNNMTDQKRLKFEVKMKVGRKYEHRSLELRCLFDESGKQEWILYIIKYADYTSYDYFSLSDSFIIQLFDETKNSKCTLVLVEDVLRFKMSSLSDKWRFVEFIRANLESKAHLCSGTLEIFPLQTTMSLPIHVLFHHTCLLIISQNTQKIIAHKSLFDFEMLVFKSKKLVFVCKTPQKLPELWSIHIENLEKLSDLLTEGIEIRDLPITMNQMERETSEYVQIPSADSVYTDF
ncbi:CRE-SDZ-13 protein [Caenorhabditis remanei]|uniref:CRE-SDZ-13 protein n=1 Tax=Caenorhabditis remanei TaxID=31234 RepID=E3M556_CAERE|nr:CRE-SDZ-13 protein [Caenorhabditis remanei]